MRITLKLYYYKNILPNLNMKPWMQVRRDTT